MDEERAALTDLMARADELEDQWRWEESLAAWEAARAAAEGDERALGDCEAGRGRVLFALDRHDEADAAEDVARRHYLDAGHPALALVCEANQAWQRGISGEVQVGLDQALAAVEGISALTDADDDELVLADGRARQAAARLLFAADRPDEGTAAYLAARDRYADAGDARRVARCDASLAADLLAVGRNEDAEGRAEAALAAFSLLDAAADAGRMELVLGQIRVQDPERLGEALESFVAAKDRFADLDLPAFTAEALHLEGLTLTALGRDDDAVDAFEAAVEAGEAAGLDAGVAATRLELGPALARLGHDEEATRCLDAAREQMTAAGDGVGAARASYAL
ncbi:MAG: hypothetical protein JWM89_2044, partial [Acidimicrobiales bacterium]|nr:hypothetical protein [Acidimicrobiales bacterium]